MSSILAPLSDILCAIGPYLFSVTVAEAALPLSGINGTALKGVCASLFTSLVWIEWLYRGDRLFGFFISEILAATDILGAKHRDVLPCLVPSESGLNLDNLLGMPFQKLFDVGIACYAVLRTSSVISATSSSRARLGKIATQPRMNINHTYLY
jgi:hypothetical protein